MEAQPLPRAFPLPLFSCCLCWCCSANVLPSASAWNVFPLKEPALSAVWRLGLPVALERATVSVAQIIITAVITGIGTTAVAANHLAVTAESISYLPAYGVAVAATTLVGQAVGAGRKDLAKRFARLVTWIGILVMTFGGLLLFCLAPQLIRIFTSESEVVALGHPGPAHRGLCGNRCSAHPSSPRCLRGDGIPKGLSSSGLATMWGVRITLSFLLAGSSA